MPQKFIPNIIRGIVMYIKLSTLHDAPIHLFFLREGDSLLGIYTSFPLNDMEMEDVLRLLNFLASFLPFTYSDAGKTYKNLLNTSRGHSTSEMIPIGHFYELFPAKTYVTNVDV